MYMCLGVWLLVCLITFLVEAKVVVAKEWGNRVVGCSEGERVEKKRRKNRNTRTGRKGYMIR